MNNELIKGTIGVDTGASVRSSTSSHTFLSQSDHSGNDSQAGTWNSSMLSSPMTGDRPSDEDIEIMFAQTAVRDLFRLLMLRSYG